MLPSPDTVESMARRLAVHPDTSWPTPEAAALLLLNTGQHRAREIAAHLDAVFALGRKLTEVCVVVFGTGEDFTGAPA